MQFDAIETLALLHRPSAPAASGRPSACLHKRFHCYITSTSRGHARTSQGVHARKKHDTKQRKARSDTVQLAAAVAIGKRTVKSEESETKIAIRAWVSDVRTLLIDYVIRRSVHSTDRDGRSIIRLPPWRDIIVPVTLREDELMVQHHLADRLREERSKLTTTGLESRPSCSQPRLSD
ncbi:hypothetical protein NUW54_g2051 [Trametes sanguinea]|uniref:Uncharacterized protein n=1 Tax=Trametes sanguinea TaxID=158606 RepID=A0ACC1Q7J8_9APHY|nr:hypothetical protein NUW54_g2051 [Trametes sanguinea]